MARGEEMLKRVAKEYASELYSKTKDPNYPIVLEREECIRKLSVILEGDFMKISNIFDAEVEKYLNLFKHYKY